MNEQSFKIIEKKNFWFSVSTFVIGLGIVLMGVRAMQSQPILNFGIDFSGGSTMLLKFDDLNQSLAAAKNDDQKREINAQFSQKIRNVLGGYGLSNASIQTTQTGDVVIKTIQMDGAKQDKIREGFQQKIGKFDVLELDFIGPSIGAELKTRSIWIVILVSMGLMAYISWRFDFAFGMATLAATLHDALVMISVASIFNLEISVEYIAAILTILGYSMNDTVVIFDRIRENIPLLAQMSLETMVNKSLFQTLSRTFYTVLTTLIVTTCLVIFGGATIKEFSVVLLVGIITGTYSSLFIAAPVFVLFKKKVTQTN